ncbi:MAG TPA: universal stress protein [Gemmatimonadales bacterium]|nr:universal stress protein [Gemmatimonadales bacterium]
MSFKSIVAGVDASPQGTLAAQVAVRVAEAAAVPRWLVHGSRLSFDPPVGVSFLTDVERLVEQQLDAARQAVTAALRDRVPAQDLAALEVRFGPPAGVIVEIAHERKAGLMVVGGKHHGALARWTGGSTALNLVRCTDTPLLVAGPYTGAFRRILLAVDLSHALQPTFQTAMRFARLFDAGVRVVHVVEPLPALAELPVTLSDESLYADSEEQLHRSLEPLTENVAVDTAVLRGPAAPTVAQHAESWKADLVVVGSHGKGWMHRLLVGSVTEQLLERMPASLLVVPVPAPAETGRRRAARAQRERAVAQPAALA